MSACIYDDLSPCENCGKCDMKPMYKQIIDDVNEETFEFVSYDGGDTWTEEVY